VVLPTGSRIEGFKRVASVLRDDEWLARDVECILASGRSASPGRTAPRPLGTQHQSSGCPSGAFTKREAAGATAGSWWARAPWPASTTGRRSTGWWGSLRSWAA